MDLAVTQEGSYMKISVFDFMTAAEIADVQAGTQALDVTNAIQAALNAVDTSRPGFGGVVLFPPGAYRVTATLTAKSNTHLAGSGSRIGCSIVRYTDYGNTIECIGAQGFQCTDLDFYHAGNFAGTEPVLPNLVTSGSHLFITNGNHVFIERCLFYRMRYGITALGGAWVHIKDNLFSGVFNEADINQQEGFSSILCDQELDAQGNVISSPVEWWIQGNNFAGAKITDYIGYQIVTFDGTYTTVADDHFIFGMAPAQAIEIRALESAWISGNYFGERSRYGILFNGRETGGAPFNPLNVRILGNMFDPCITAQIGFVTAVDHCAALNTTIVGNTFVGNKSGRTAILSAPAPTNTPTTYGLTITGNVFMRHFGCPIILDASKGFSVVGNVINNYNSLNAASRDTAYVAAVAVRQVSSKGLVANNTVGAGDNFSDDHYCYQGIYIDDRTTTEVVQSGNHRVGTHHWTAQTYPR
jgi:hypothetical protein